ncbi:hypothetical protein [Sphingomonas sp. PB4P5]|uniref:hypothetical protein n=1 Tax=Parasphingomonas puruogangriensis TaxID=3096155 RepID=UPI002FCA832C
MRTTKNWSADEDARFFDNIADGWTIRAAAIAVGRSGYAGCGRFHRARLAMGAQAV